MTIQREQSLKCANSVAETSKYVFSYVKLKNYCLVLGLETGRCAIFYDRVWDGIKIVKVSRSTREPTKQKMMVAAVQ